MNVTAIDKDVRRDFLTQRGQLLAAYKEARSEVAGEAVQDGIAPDDETDRPPGLLDDAVQCT